MKNKHVGILLIIISFFFLLVTISFNNALETITSATCSHGATCTMTTALNTQKTISYGLIGILTAVGVFIMLLIKDEKETPKKKRLNKLNLSDEEKLIIKLLEENDGSIYQSDIIKETNIGKVKITRILDKLEGRKLIDRRRRGMANIVILK